MHFSDLCFTESKRRGMPYFSISRVQDSLDQRKNKKSTHVNCGVDRTDKQLETKALNLQHKQCLVN